MTQRLFGPGPDAGKESDICPKFPWRLDIGLSTDTGSARSLNEDYARAEAVLGLVVVADGMGGHEAGEVASELAVETLFEFLWEAHTNGKVPLSSLLRDAVAAANIAVIERAAEEKAQQGMGTTLTALLLEDKNFWIGHVGDTRAWRARNGSVDQITRDHSLVGERVRSGQLSPAAAKTHPMRNVLTQALGHQTELKIDLYSGKVQPEDRFVLATDGLVNAADADTIERLIYQSEHASAASQALVSYACEHDGSDNITAVVVQCEVSSAEESLEQTADDALQTPSLTLGPDAHRATTSSTRKLPRKA